MRARTPVVIALALALGACGAEPPIVPGPSAPPPGAPPSIASAPSASAPCPPVPVASAKPRQRELLPFTAAVLRFDRRFPSPVMLSTDGRTLAVWEPNRVGHDEAGVYIEYPHARMTIVDVQGDRVVDTLNVDDGDARKDEAAALGRVATVERAFTARAWEPLVAYELSADPSAPPPPGDDAPTAMIARGEGLTVQYREPTLTMIDDGGGKVLSRDFPGWTMSALLPRAKCPARGVLARVWGRRARGIALVELAYDGHCGYWGASHVVRLGT